MKNVIVFFSLLTTILVNAQENKQVDYIRNHAILAVKEMEIYKIPASITLAQGLLETGGGQSRLADKANNHFGIKCKTEKEWPKDKPRIYHDDDAKGECFRMYSSVEESYRDHSEFLALRPYYKNLFTLQLTDYKGWAHGLKKSGYATNPAYANTLIKLIEKYNLDKFDTLAEQEVYAKLYNLYGNDIDKQLALNKTDNDNLTKEERNTIKKSDTYKELDKNIEIVKSETEKKETIAKAKIENYDRKFTNPYARVKNHPNNIQYVVAQAGETLGSLAKLFKKTPSDLAKYNEIYMGSKLKEGQIVFFNEKKTKGSQNIYKVKANDDLYGISQTFGVKLKKLYKFNDLKPNDKLVEGQEIYLKNKKRT